jgi:hypothetical protein
MRVLIHPSGRGICSGMLHFRSVNRQVEKRTLAPGDERTCIRDGRGNEAAFSALYIGQGAEAIEFDFINPVGMIEWFGPTGEPHGLECGRLAHAGIMAQRILG